jgi:hypothetical protein
MPFAQVAETECDDFQTAVLMNQVEHKKQRNHGVPLAKCHLIYPFYFLRSIPGM